MVSNFNLVFTNSDILQIIFKFQRPMVKYIKKHNYLIATANSFINILDKILKYDRKTIVELWDLNFDETIPKHLYHRNKNWKNDLYNYLINRIIDKYDYYTYVDFNVDTKLKRFFQENGELNKCLDCLKLGRDCYSNKMYGNEPSYDDFFVIHYYFTIDYFICEDCQQKYFDRVKNKVKKNRGKPIKFYRKQI